MTEKNDKIRKYESHAGIYVFKAKNRKSLTIPVKREQIPEGNEELILNVSLEAFKAFLENETQSRLEFNRIRYI